MFVKKFVEKVSKKNLLGLGLGGVGGNAVGLADGIRGLSPEDVYPRLLFHYGVPSGACSLAYDTIQHIVAVATNDGRIKLFGKNNTQALLQSDSAVSTKFLQFLDGQGIIFNVTVHNHIEVWDIDKKELCCVHILKEEITAFAVVQHTCYMYVGDRLGSILVFKFDKEHNNLTRVEYRIPSTEVHTESQLAGTENTVDDDAAVVSVLPQPMAEAKRILIIYRNGHIILWALSESKPLFSTGGNSKHFSQHEQKRVVSACWACPVGSKVVVGYSSGDIFIWSIPAFSDHKNALSAGKKEFDNVPNVPLHKLNLGFKMDKIPIVSLKWTSSDRRTGRLYINGFSGDGHLHLFQVVLLHENNESQTVKLILPLSEPCLAVEIISQFRENNKHKQYVLLLLLKSGDLCLYDDSEIENYLSQSQSRTREVPKSIMVKLPFCDSRITVMKLYSCQSESSSSLDEDYSLLANKYPSLLSINKKEKEASHLQQINEYNKAKRLYITGHHDGSINFWDASCPLLLLLFTINRHGEGSKTLSAPVTALHFDMSSQILIYGDQTGMLHIHTFKKDKSSSDNIFSFLQGKQGSNYTTSTVKLNGAIVTVNMNARSKHLAVGTAKGYVSVIDMEGINVMYDKHFSSQLSSNVISLQFEIVSKNGFANNVILVGLEDSSIFALEEDTGKSFSVSSVHTKKPRRALLMHIIDNAAGFVELEATSKQSLLLVCSESDIRLYLLSHAIQGIKKLYGKKRLNGTCCAASLICSPKLEVGIILVFQCGRVEIRSLPSLSLLNEAEVRGFPFSTFKRSTNASGAICATSEGEVIMVNQDQEMFFFTTSPRGDIYRHLDFISQVYKKDLVISQEDISSPTTENKEKKKGIFTIVSKDIKGSKVKNGLEAEAVSSPGRLSDRLSSIFSTANFPLDDEKQDSPIQHEDDELDIDDIDLEDTKESPKGQTFSAFLNKQKLGKKLQSIRGKLKPKTDQNVSTSVEGPEDKSATEAVAQIKRKYGYTVNNEPNAADIARSRLSENIKKLQNISMKTTEMQDNAQSFSSVAKELLQTVKNKKSP